MSEFAVKGAELKKMLGIAKNGPINFGFSPGKSDATSVLCMHRTKSAKALGTAAKDDSNGNMFSYGTAEVIGKTLRLTCERLGIPKLATKVKRFLKSQKAALNVEIFNDQGVCLDGDVEDDLPDDPDLLEGDGDDKASVTAAKSSSPGQMKPLDAERAKLAAQLSTLSPRIKALPPKLQARVGNHFKSAIEQTKSGNTENASKLLNQIESVLQKIEEATLASDAASVFGESKPAPARPSSPAPAKPSTGEPAADEAAAVFGESQASPLDPLQLRAINDRMIRIAKEKFPAMLVRAKAHMLKQAKGLVDSGKLEEASKLLDELEAKAARSGQAPKAGWQNEEASAPTPETSASSAPKPAMPAGKVAGVDIYDKKAFKALELKYKELIKPIEKFKQSNVPAVRALDKDIQNIIGRQNVLANFQGKLDYYTDKDQPEKVKEAIDEANKFVSDFKILEQKLNAAIAAEIDAKSKSDPEKPRLSSGKSATDEMKSLFPDSFNFMAKSALLQAEKYAQDMGTKKNRKRGVDSLSLGEVVAIYSYTCEDFKEINPYMRNMRDGMSVERQKELSKQAEAAASGLKDLPTYKGPVYRYDSDAEYFMKSIASNNIRSDKSFFSTSKVPGNTAFGSLLSVIEHKNGREIDFSLHEKEGEVIFLPGTVFAFKSFTPDDSDLAKFNMQKSKPIKDVNLLKSVLDQHFQEGKTLLKGTFELKEK